MRNSPRKRSGHVSCSTPVEIFSVHQLNRIPVGELRHLAAEKHGIKNAGLLRKPDLLEKLREHFESRHGLELQDDKEEDNSQEVSPISQTIDKLRSRIKDKKSGNVKDEDAIASENLVGSADRLLELAEHVLTTSADHQPQQVEIVTETIVPADQIQVVESTEEVSVQHQFDPSDVISEEVISNTGETFYEEYITSDNIEIVNSNEIVESNDIVDSSEAAAEEMDAEEEMQELEDENSLDGVSSTTLNLQTAYQKGTHNQHCGGYVVAKTVKELRDLGRDMLRIHAENHGIDYASRLRLPELLKEVIEHYNQVHGAGLEVSKLEMLKLNMLKLKKVKVAVRDRTPPPDYSKLIPKNVVPLEEQVHHVYEKRPDVCTVDIIVNNLKDMLALGTSILRPEASKHRVANSSRKQKLQVVEELWEHYLKFHLKETEGSELVEEEYDTEHSYQGYRTAQPGFMVVREEDIVHGEEIQAVAEEITE